RKSFEKFKLSFYDGFITISNELLSFYSSINNNVFLLPMTIDVDRFEGVTRQNVRFPYVAVVFGTHNRDGLYDSIQAYKRYCELKREDCYKLVLVGNFNKLPDREKIITFINEH